MCAKYPNLCKRLVGPLTSTDPDLDDETRYLFRFKN